MIPVLHTLIRSIRLPFAMQVYQLMRVGSLLLIGILLAHSGLSLTELGNWEALLYIGSMVIFLGINGLLQGMSPVYAGLEATLRPRFFVQVFWVFSVIGILAAVLFWWGIGWLIPGLTGRAALPHFSLFCVYLVFQIATLPTEIIYLLQQKPLSILVWGMVGFGLQIPAVVVPVYVGWGLEGAVLGLLALSFAKWLWTLCLVFFSPGQRSTPQLVPALVRRWLQFSAPVVVATLVANLISLTDPLLVGHYFSEASVFAIYRYGSRELPLALALSTALGTALVPALSQDLAAGLVELRHRSTRLFHWIFPLSIVLLLTAPYWFPRVFSEALSEAVPLFQTYLLISVSRVLLPSAILLSLGDTAVFLRVNLLELSLKIVLGILGAELYGLEGIAWSFVLACWFEKIALGWHLARRHGIYPADWINLPWLVGYGLVLGLVRLVSG